MLTLYDSLSRARRTLTPPATGPLTLYCCGPTVYRDAHIGNLRTFLLADLVRRALAYRGIPVRAVQNITDVGHLTDDRLDHGQDRMLVSAGLEGRSSEEIAAHYTRAYQADAEALNLMRYDVQPAATAHIAHMIRLAERLQAAGHTYEGAQALYFAVPSFAGYGRLSGNRLGMLQPGHRMQVQPDKRFHGDFALWRKAGPGRQAVWDSPWGPGFPGWHIECSAMSMAYLGERIDVHLGGVDLAFPHHECEIAQSDGAVGHQVVAHWVHGEHLLAGGRKMAKSAGNYHTVRTLPGDPLAFRLLCLQARYRTQLNFTAAALAAAQRSLDRLRARVADLSAAGGTVTGAEDGQAVERRFVDAIEDDLDTPAALAVVHEVAGGHDLGLAAADRLAALRRWDTILGLRLEQRPTDGGALPPGAAERIEARERARAGRDYALADRLRDELAGMGVAVTDSPDGPRWSVAPATGPGTGRAP